jgi:Fe-S oxidoreductase
MYTKMLQEYAQQLFENHEIESLIGYETGSRGVTRPVFIRDQSDVKRLVLNETCTHNLVGYLRQHLDQADGSVAVVVKPCDSRAINVLIAENRIDRKRLHVIGVICEGIAKHAPHQVLLDENLQDRCLSCELHEPLVYDHLVGDVDHRRSVKTHGEAYQDIAWLEEAASDERMDYWIRQFDRCIRCYACRQACPMCDCPTCLFEREDSMWIGAGSGVQEKRTFHLGRAYHLAGRCVGCNECERVCPVEIPISKLNQILARELEDLYQHRAGYERVLSPITTILGVKD